tara:strand:+ start:183 stop:563 length:381 start_codon:yes stop_codon:yes gene_type:complete
MEFVSPENAKKNIIILPKKTKKKKIVKRKPSRKYVLLPPRMLNLPKATKQPSMIHYHYLSGFGRPSSLNEAQQPSFHGGNSQNSRPSSPDFEDDDIYLSTTRPFQFENPLFEEFLTPLAKVKEEDN